MAKLLDVASIYQRIDKAKELANKIYEQSFKPNKKTIVLRFARSYFVFVAGDNSLKAYPLSTTKYKWFNYASDIYDFLVSKDIKEVIEFDGELSYLEIRQKVQK